MLKNFLNLIKDMNQLSKKFNKFPDTQEHKEIHTETCIIKLLKDKDKERTLKAVRGKQHYKQKFINKVNSFIVVFFFSTESIEAVEQHI